MTHSFFRYRLSGLLWILCITSQAWAIRVDVDPTMGQRPISPYIYGKNNALSDNPKTPLKESQWQRLRDAGVTILRENGGNNATKYNWRLKLSSHPDWYNNVYAHDWDYEAQSLQTHLPGVQGMWAFQLIGKAAATSAYNFNDWAYNHSQWWEGVSNNWAGGGGHGGRDDRPGDPSLYLMDWSAQDTTSILDHWLDPNEFGLDPNALLYWNLDNEPEIWSSSHDDVFPEQPDAETFMQRYFEVTKQARARFPQIKLCGPVTANEWQWYNWDNGKIQQGPRTYTWLEYFIKRVSEEQQATGIRLLDVLDIHFYPGDTDPNTIMQLHRVWFDKTYDYPQANGVKRAGDAGWDPKITQEYIFERCTQWLDQYMGPDHGVTFGVSETGIKPASANVTAVWYASNLGVFADHGVELFTPWYWRTGMWEVLHLFSRYQQAIRTHAESDEEILVSAYASINEDANAMTVMLVNRSPKEPTPVTLYLDHATVPETCTTLTLSNLPEQDTFVSHTDNALVENTLHLNENVLDLTLAPLSITAVLFKNGVIVESKPRYER